MRIAVGLGKKDGDERLERQGISRRDFMKFCTAVAVTMGFGPSFASEVAAALTGRRPSVVYLHCAECTGCSEALLRTYKPFIDAVILDTISLDYHETIMAAAGDAAEEALQAAVANPNGFVCMVEGAIPTAQDNKFGYIAGHTMYDICKGILPKAKAVVNIGTCACYGGVQAAKPQSHRRQGRQRMLCRPGRQGHQHPWLPPQPPQYGRRAGGLPPGPEDRPGRTGSPHHVLRPERARPLRTPQTLRRRRICALLQFRRSAQRLVPLRSGLQRAGDVQQLSQGPL